MPMSPDELDRDRKERIRVEASARLDRVAARAVNSLRVKQNAVPFGHIIARITGGPAPEPMAGLDIDGAA
jgi:hypothetical protein